MPNTATSRTPKSMSAILFTSALLFCLGNKTYAATETAIQHRQQQIQALFCAQPSGFEDIFDAAFLQAVPPAKLTPPLQEYFTKNGDVVTVRVVESKGPYYAEYNFYTKRTVFPVKIGVNSSPPHGVTLFWFGATAPRLRSVDEAVNKMKELPGSKSFALAKLDDKGVHISHAVDADQALAIGSTFKLYILGALIEQVAAKKRQWQQTIELRSEHKSWPSGVLHTWPNGTPMTMASLATLMISKSDNTATDHLLMELGRNNVEAMLRPMGNKNEKKNLPFLSTREMFLLKSTIPEATQWRQSYLAGKVNARRTLLKNKLSAVKRESFNGLDASKPLAVDKIEWFASASDLCRTMDWLRRHTASAETALGRELLSVNPGLKWDKNKWDYVGYKGGSEMGVLNLTWLFQRKSDGQWFAMSASWNNSEKNLDDGKLEELLQGIILVLETPQK